MGMQRRSRKFLHRDELAALIAVKAPAHERLALDLFLDTGVRVSELVSANVADLWLDDGERVHLSVSVKGRGRSRERKRPGARRRRGQSESAWANYSTRGRRLPASAIERARRPALIF